MNAAAVDEVIVGLPAGGLSATVNAHPAVLAPVQFQEPEPTVVPVPPAGPLLSQIAARSLAFCRRVAYGVLLKLLTSDVVAAAHSPQSPAATVTAVGEASGTAPLIAGVATTSAPPHPE